VIDATAIRWESIVVIAASFGLAVWALRDPKTAAATESSAPGAARLALHGRSGPARIVEIDSGAVLGRASACTVVLDDPTVSKHHARIAFDARAWIEDLDSTNGTFVNGRRITGSAPLRRGDRIALGAAKLSFLGLAPRNSGWKG
jgi:hypothetical protein